MPTNVNGKEVGDIGYGLLGLTWRSKLPTEEEAFAALRAALDTGCNLWNGGEFYGSPDYNSLTLLNKYFAKYPEDANRVVLNVKGATRPDMTPDGGPEFVRKSVENCLKMLGNKGRIDMFECARRDPNVPLKETLGALAELVDEGKIGAVALSEVNANTIREAAKITRIAAVEIELSLWSTEPLSNGIVEACAELRIPIHAYSPVGYGMLTGQIKSYEDLADNDLRKILPRFQPQNFDVNMKLVRELEKIAAKRACTPAQLALGWLLTLSNRDGIPTIIPIPGTTKVERIKENAGAVRLTEDEMDEIDKILAKIPIAGDRYHAAGMKSVNG
ncbi:MAG: hypothetical protein Q9217_001689 [Psora testacea]